MNEPAVYTVQLIGPDGEPLGKRQMRIWPEDLLAVEYKGHLIGMELARDAIHKEGFWDAFRAEQLKRGPNPNQLNG